MDKVMNTVPWLGAGHKAPRIAVIGDVILDEYLNGVVNRISPEAPVPVHRVTGSVYGAGGAANAARNLKLCGGDVHLLSVWGQDEAAQNLRGLLAADGIDTSGMCTSDDRPTIRKTRITSSNRYQLARIDWEKVHPVTEAVEGKILENLGEIEADAVLISDYGKGLLSDAFLRQLISHCQGRGIPVAVDPKSRDYRSYSGASLITPNRKEACEALGHDPDSDWSGEDLGRQLQETFNLGNVLVTLGPKGMVMVPGGSKKGESIHLPAVAREVYDVSGAGDTVAAIMTLGLASKAEFAETMHVATAAAAVVVGKWGTQPIHLHELEATLREHPDPARHVHSSQGKVSDLESLKRRVSDARHAGQKVVFTNGCFDVLHAGHVEYLEQAKALGDILVIGVNSDASVRALKGDTRPVVPHEQRMRLLAALGCVDYVVGFEEETPYNLIKGLVPDVLVKASDWGKDEIVGSDVVEGAGGTVMTLDFVQGLSTTNIVEKIKGS